MSDDTTRPPWPGYERRWLLRDLVGGATASAVVIPQALAYATIAGLPVSVGLYTCMVPAAVYVVLGGSRTLSVSTTSTVAVLSASTLVAADTAAGAPDPTRSVATLTLLVGLALLAARLVRLGSLVEYISEATLTGIRAGTGVTIAVGQLPKLLGVPGAPAGSHVATQLDAVVTGGSRTSLTTLALAAGSVAVLLGLRRLAPQVPAPLVVVALGIILSAAAVLDRHGVALLGPVPAGLPRPVLPDPAEIGPLLPGVVAVAVMGFLESIAAARSSRRSDEPPIGTDRELTALGLAGIAGAFLQSLPAAGGLSQTTVNRAAGSRTQLSSLVVVAVAVACALVLGGVLARMPEATLGALVVVAGLGLVRPGEFARFWRLSRPEFWVATATAVAALALGLLGGVLVGVLLTLVLLLRALDRVGIEELRLVAGADGDDLLPADATTENAGPMIVRIAGPLYTANVRAVNRRLLDAVDARPGTTTLVVDVSALERLSLTVVDQYGELDHALTERGVTLVVAGASPAALELARRTPRWAALVDAGRVYPTTLSAARAQRKPR